MLCGMICALQWTLLNFRFVFILVIIWWLWSHNRLQLVSWPCRDMHEFTSFADRARKTASHLRCAEAQQLKQGMSPSEVSASEKRRMQYSLSSQACHSCHRESSDKPTPHSANDQTSVELFLSQSVSLPHALSRSSSAALLQAPQQLIIASLLISGPLRHRFNFMGEACGNTVDVSLRGRFRDCFTNDAAPLASSNTSIQDH